MTQDGNDFNAIRISLASPDQIKVWSYGEVTKPETINYRTLRPEKDGLFCERIFGPTRDWECYCGKYKKIRYKGVICDRCGVEVARSKVRRERMGHVALAAPVAHIWFSKGTPSRLGLLLDLSPRNLDRVLYFAQYLMTAVDDNLRNHAVDRLKKHLEEGLDRLTSDAQKQIEQLTVKDDHESEESVTQSPEGQEENEPKATAEEINAQLAEHKNEFENEIARQIDDLTGLRIGQLLTESRHRELKDAYGSVFKANMGAEAVLEALRSIDMEALRNELQNDMESTSGQRRKKAIKRMRVVEAFRKSGNKPEWMVFTTLPILPPELRPMVQLDGGRFATSDLNDLYRRVINRNNRLRRLIELRAPEIIIRNEKRMLQEAVDALVDNGRRGRAVAGTHNHRLKSLSDLLRGKQGRFRQNLLGKRVDYSGRSVIISGPELKLNQCGIPRRMALELFKPFVMNRLVIQGYAHNIKSAKRMAEEIKPEVWDILEEVVQRRPVLLNRAPTLHRLGIQAFEPVLIDGSAIQVHPLACTAFNADFDGDQMAVHVPLSKEAVLEAKRLMLSTFNMLSPSSGDPIVAPTLDMVLGCYYLTIIEESADDDIRQFASFEDARLAYEVGSLDLRTEIQVRNNKEGEDTNWLNTSAGRIIFNDVLPPAIGFLNQEMDKSALKDITANCHRLLGSEQATMVLDNIKSLGFHYAGKAGITLAINDIEVSPEKDRIVAEADGKVDQLDQQYLDGLITEDERYTNAVQIWTDANDNLTNIIEQNLRNYGGIYLMATSGAKGNIAQIKQMAGMRGLMSDPKGRIIGRPIKSNFREGLTVLEYFISTHGARKGLADTALRTADSGYLTRRLIDVAQEVIVLSADCETTVGIWINNEPEDTLMSSFVERIRSRIAAVPIADPNTGEIIVDRNEIIDDEISLKIEALNIPRVLIRSPLICAATRGVCQMCYGMSLASMKLVMLGEAVGIIAAQSIGEPGTQLTMRTFHTGGIAAIDITSGLPRVEELFEARSPKGEAILAEIDGMVEISETSEGRSITLSSTEHYHDEYDVPENHSLQIDDGDLVKIGAPLTLSPDESDAKDAEAIQPSTSNMIARVSGIAHIENNKITIAWADEDRREYVIPAASHIIVQSGDQVVAGQALTAGPKSPQQILRIQGRDAVQKYLIEEVQKVYRSQGVTMHDKHIEVIISQMLRKVRIDNTGDTTLFPGELVDHSQYEETNASILAEGGEPATASPVMLGITKASLNMDSVLAAASFQETTRVLTESAVNGDVDYLRGLKENVIIGRLIPARLDLSQEGRDRLGVYDLSEEPLEDIAPSLPEENSVLHDMGDATEGLIEQAPVT